MNVYVHAKAFANVDRVVVGIVFVLLLLLLVNFFSSTPFAPVPRIRLNSVSVTTNRRAPGIVAKKKLNKKTCTHAQRPTVETGKVR